MLGGLVTSFLPGIFVNIFSELRFVLKDKIRNKALKELGIRVLLILK